MGFWLEFLIFTVNILEVRTSLGFNHSSDNETIDGIGCSYCNNSAAVARNVWEQIFGSNSFRWVGNICPMSNRLFSEYSLL